MKLPNIMNENVISFVSALPKEFELEPYIDYDTQFQKSFVEPLGVILDKIGWTTEPVSTLDSFFGQDYEKLDRYKFGSIIDI